MWSHGWQLKPSNLCKLIGGSRPSVCQGPPTYQALASPPLMDADITLQHRPGPNCLRAGPCQSLVRGPHLGDVDWQKKAPYDSVSCHSFLWDVVHASWARKGKGWGYAKWQKASSWSVMLRLAGCPRHEQGAFHGTVDLHSHSPIHRLVKDKQI